ncbi:MAG: protein-disulfide reductase DsbD N-terminal domain-containing protein [Bryocella sp.]
MKPRTGWVVALAAAVVMPLATAQMISLGDAGASSARKGHLVLLSDDVTVAAGKADVVELRFRIDEGYHINSHTPKNVLLIPTALKLDAAHGVTVLGEEYPAGRPFQVGKGKDSMSLEVYQGEFRVRVKLLAVRGGQTLTGVLRYQACDDASCFPPKSIPIRVAVNAR